MVPAGDATATPAEGEPGNLTPEQKKVVAIVCGVLAAAVVVLLAIFLSGVGRHGDTVFLVRATDPNGLDPVRSPVVHPSFSLTLRVDNGWLLRDCWENITITVFYGNTIVGWGGVPDFCLHGGESVEVKVALSHTEVVLTDALRGHMASQLSTGDLEFEVEMRMLLSKWHIGLTCESCASRQGFQFCTLNPGRQSYAPCQLVHLRRTNI